MGFRDFDAGDREAWVGAEAFDYDDPSICTIDDNDAHYAIVVDRVGITYHNLRADLVECWAVELPNNKVASMIVATALANVLDASRPEYHTDVLVGHGFCRVA